MAKRRGKRYYPKRRLRVKGKRNFDDPKYVAWRKAVYERDKFKCRVCNSDNKIEAHHIRTWAKNPHLRFIVSNGITLCEKHHKMTLQHEEMFAAMFFRLLGNQDN